HWYGNFSRTGESDHSDALDSQAFGKNAKGWLGIAGAVVGCRFLSAFQFVPERRQDILER
ncbi:hypothetical protein, partial [Francisella tularensis]|uniref:hypothetical protein n=1 Tax=Francisella tularensis TaxID=263 RepID=UPI001F41BFAF